MQSIWSWIRRQADVPAFTALLGAVLSVALWPTLANWKLREANQQLKLLVAGGFALAFVVSISIVILNMLWPAKRRADNAPLRCAKCGYDLRASNDRCPECGTAIPTIEYESSSRSRADGEDCG